MDKSFLNLVVKSAKVGHMTLLSLLLSPRNATVIIVLLVCALSTVGSLYLIQELDRPYEGLITISSTPLRTALAILGR